MLLARRYGLRGNRRYYYNVDKGVMCKIFVKVSFFQVDLSCCSVCSFDVIWLLRSFQFPLNYPQDVTEVRTTEQEGDWHQLQKVLGARVRVGTS